MALTQITSKSITDGTIATADIADDAVTEDKLADSINSAIAANTAKDLTTLSASNLTSGTIPDARLPATLPAISGENLTNLPASGSARNLIINGAMQIAQRGTSSSSWSGIGYPACDRQKTLGSYGGTWTISQSTEAPSDNGFTRSTKYDCTTAVTSVNANGYLQHYYRVEGYDLQSVCKGTSNAKPLILSFWVKTNKTGTYNVEAIDQDNSRLSSFSYTVANTNWNKYTIVFPADTTGAFDNDNGASLDIGWWLVAGSTFNSGSNQNSFGTFTQANRAPSNVNLADSTSNEWYITGIQLEVDSAGSGVATDFEHRSYAEELALCQRYYWKPSSSSSGFGFYGQVYHTSHSFVDIPLPTTMRTHPTATGTVVVSGSGAHANTTVTSEYLQYYATNDKSVYVTYSTVSADAEL